MGLIVGYANILSVGMAFFPPSIVAKGGRCNVVALVTCMYGSINVFLQRGKCLQPGSE